MFLIRARWADCCRATLMNRSVGQSSGAVFARCIRCTTIGMPTAARPARNSGVKKIMEDRGSPPPPRQQRRQERVVRRRRAREHVVEVVLEAALLVALEERLEL